MVTALIRLPRSTIQTASFLPRDWRARISNPPRTNYEGVRNTARVQPTKRTCCLQLRCMAATNDIDGYWTLSHAHESFTEVKKSKFIVHAWPIASAAEAVSLIESAKEQAASHNCWAYKVGTQTKSFDDGEPGGTAGQPILASIENSDLDAVCVLVIRYFGGIKLGAGGLIRAYHGCVQDCLNAAPRVYVVKLVSMTVDAGFDTLGVIYNILNKHKASAIEQAYTPGGRILLKFQVPQQASALVQGAVADATSGAVVPKLVPSGC